jgi:3-oxoacyl-[acyl-carrier-protein] synthase II
VDASVTGAVVVTGIGTIGCYGAGCESLRRALAQSAPVLTAVDSSAGLHEKGGSRHAALARGLDLSPWVTPAAARRMSGPSKLAVAAARMAIAEAGLAGDEVWDDTGVTLATAFGPADFTERMLRAIFDGGPQSATPFHFMESVANAPAGHVAIECQARGPNVTVTQREAGPLIALGRAAADVAAGRARRALAGSVEEITPLLHAMLDRFGALAHAEGARSEAARPFDRRRNGLVAGEGATVLLLETEGDAQARGARVLARVRGGGSAFDPSASRVGWGNGAETLADGLARLLARLGLTVAQIDVVVSGASGSRAGDRLEARVLRTLYPDGQLPVVLAPKSVTGEYGGGVLATAALLVGGGELGPTAGFSEADPELGVVPHLGGRITGGRVLASSLAAGGAGAWVVLERP